MPLRAPPLPFRCHPKVTYITPDAETVVVENAEGSLMGIAVDNQVDGIEGACGGVCSCATCHVKRV
ncbi:MAG TPA: hypothetical protein DCR55_02400 [Lentisphaeria bacterium]|nr:hypothetical protein [Lentisphaeria bacterium]